MTISTVEPYVEYLDGLFGINLYFPIPFDFVEPEHVKVGLILRSGEHVTLEYGEGADKYTIVDHKETSEDSTEEAQNYVFCADITKYNMVKLFIYRQTPIDQEAQFVSQTIDSEILKKAIDKLTCITQEQEYAKQKRYLHLSSEDEDSTEHTALPSFELGTYMPLYRNDEGVINTTPLDFDTFKIHHMLRQVYGEWLDSTFVLKKEERKNKILGFDANGHVQYRPWLQHGSNMQYAEENVIADVSYIAGKNIAITPKGTQTYEISSTISKIEYSAGQAIKIEDNVVSLNTVQLDKQMYELFLSWIEE